MSAPKRALCSVCQRQVSIRKDGRLRAHLAARGRRGECEGSGQFSARVVVRSGNGLRLDLDPDAVAWDQMTPAQRFNAAEEWALVHALAGELQAMEELDVNWPGQYDTILALRRAYDRARALAPMGVMRGAWGGGETA